MFKFTIIATSALALSACAGISVSQLNYDGSRKSSTPNGAVYYLPKPYLLVTRLPAKPGDGAGGLPDVFNTGGGAGAAPAAGGGKEGDAKQAGGEEGGGENPTPAGSGGGSSFDARTTDYVVKLIYLPDRTRPMSITASTGLFGTAKLSPTFQDGWMLTGFNSEADNKFAEVLQHVAGVITAIRAPAGGGEAAKGAGAAPGVAAQPTDVLRPGLYEFRYDNFGRLIGLCAVNYFSSQGTAPSSGWCLPLG